MPDAQDWQRAEKQVREAAANVRRAMDRATSEDAGSVRFTIPGKPVPCPRARVAFRKKAYYPKRYQDWLATAKTYARQAWLGKPLIEGRVLLSVEFYGARKNADSDNLLKGVMDALTGTVIVDDSQIAHVAVDRWPVWPGDASFCGQDPRTEVRILA
jgi:Holliday junction resolvase RusA-like endonuclease